HTASATYVTGSAVWSGGAASAIPAQTLADLASAMTAQVTAESTNGATGDVTWTASLPDEDLDFLANGETLTATFNVTVSDGNGGSATEQVAVTFKGADDAPTIASNAVAFGVFSEDSLVANGGFEVDIPFVAGWTLAGPAALIHTGHSGQLAAFLATNSSATGSFTQTIQTTAGQAYQLSFWATMSGVSNATLEVDWNGTPAATFTVPASNNVYQEYFVNLTGNGNPEALSFVDKTSGSFLTIDDVVMTPAPAVQGTQGVITFVDPDVNDTHTVGVPVAENGGQHGDGSAYVGTFTVGALTDSGGSGSVPWQFTVDSSAIQYLASGQVLQQFYDVTIADGHGGSVTQTVEVDITGTEDAPVIALADKTESGPVQAGGGGTDTASGAIHFTDVDLTDRPTGSA
ncbi:MAG TPA: VCBS domain-containing protein, partial [Mycobacteriales bacterium]|nr:VCBS domain-containing protein [Mycobacteriales bacterium]